MEGAGAQRYLLHTRMCLFSVAFVVLLCGNDILAKSQSAMMLHITPFRGRRCGGGLCTATHRANASEACPAYAPPFTCPRTRDFRPPGVLPTILRWACWANDGGRDKTETVSRASLIRHGAVPSSPPASHSSYPPVPPLCLQIHDAGTLGLCTATR